MYEYLRFRDPRGWLTEVYYNLRAENCEFPKNIRFKPKSSIEQLFWDMLTLKKIIFTVLENCTLRRKASLEVIKITLFISSHNSHSVWEWTQKLTPSPERTTSPLFFEISIVLHIYFWFWAPKGLSQSGWKRKTKLKSFKARLNCTGSCGMHLPCYECTTMRAWGFLPW